MGFFFRHVKGAKRVPIRPNFYWDWHTVSVKSKFSVSLLNFLSIFFFLILQLTILFTLGMVIKELQKYCGWKPPRSQRKGLHQCKNCFKRYTQKQTLNRHLQFECGKAPQFSCPCCEYRAKQRSNLMVHLQKQHSNHIAAFNVCLNKSV